MSWWLTGANLFVLAALLAHLYKKNRSAWLLLNIQNFPNSCKLYYNVMSQELCPDCAKKGQKQQLRWRHRFLLERCGRTVLQAKTLVSLQSCTNCNYRHLTEEELP